MWFFKLVVLPPGYIISAWHDLHQQFSNPVLAPSAAYFACLSLLIHLIQIISSLEVPIDMLPIHSVYCSLLPEQGKSVVVYFTPEHSFMVCACSEWNTFASNWNHGGISCDVHFAGHLRLNRTNIWSDWGGARGLELKTADLHPMCFFQVVLTRLFIKARCRLLK